MRGSVRQGRPFGGALVPTVLMAVATTWMSLYVLPKVGTVSLKFTATGVWFLRLVVTKFPK